MAAHFSIDPEIVLWQWRMSKLRLWAQVLGEIGAADAAALAAPQAPALPDLKTEREDALANAARVERAFRRRGARQVV